MTAKTSLVTPLKALSQAMLVPDLREMSKDLFTHNYVLFENGHRVEDATIDLSTAREILKNFSSFSVEDNGRVRLRYKHKGSPMILEFYYLPPLSDGDKATIGVEKVE